jgi:hypothetical protein
MIFRPALAAKVMAGEKSVTRRLCSDNPQSPWWREQCIYVEGKEFAVQPGRGKPSIGRARVVSCERQRLGYLNTVETLREGFADEAAFREAFAGINGKYDPDIEVWRVELEVIP